MILEKILSPRPVLRLTGERARNMPDDLDLIEAKVIVTYKIIYQNARKKYIEMENKDSFKRSLYGRKSDKLYNGW